jgi:hypothetical protein
MDISLKSNLFLRLEALYGLRLNNRFEKNAADAYKASGIEGVATKPGHGVQVKIGLGWRLGSESKR